MTESFDLFENALRRSRAPDTKRAYVRYFKDFLKRVNIRRADELLKLEPKQFEDLIKSYVDNALEDKARSIKWVYQVTFAIQFFCVANRINLNWNWIRMQVPKPEDEESADRPYTNDELVTFFKAAKSEGRDRAIVSAAIMATGGARIGALAQMRIEDLKHIGGHDMYGIRAYPSDKRSTYWVVTTPQIAPVIRDYAKGRTSGPLFIGSNREPVTTSALQKQIQRLLESSGVRKPFRSKTKRHEVVMDHGFRKFFATRLEIAKVRDDHIRRLQGHITGLKRAYQLPTLEETITTTGYLTALEALKLPL